MGMTIHQALAAANKSLMRKIDNAMNNEMFKAVQYEEIAAIDEAVYNVYSPSIYQRRYEHGGMADPDNITIAGGTAHGGVMAVVNVTEPNPGGCANNDLVTTNKNLPELITFGHGYKGDLYDFPDWRRRYMYPRPFTAKTIAHLKSSKAHITALKAGLQRQGVKVK